MYVPVPQTAWSMHVDCVCFSWFMYVSFAQLEQIRVVTFESGLIFSPLPQVA
jgi:hypothetical protein